MSETRLRRRAVLHALVLGLGAAGLGRVMFACKEDEPTKPRTDPEPKNNPDDDKGQMSDSSEYVPGESPPVIANTEAPKVPNPTWEARAKQLDGEQARLFRATVFTQASPDGPNRSASHVPNARLEPADAGLARVIVVVNHVMGQNKLDAGPTDAAAADAAKDASMDGGADGGDAGDAGDAGPTVAPPEHYITTIFLRAKVNDVDTVVGLWEFSSTDAAPPTVSFTLPAGVKSVTAYEWCTLHGLWASEALAIP